MAHLRSGWPVSGSVNSDHLVGMALVDFSTIKYFLSLLLQLQGEALDDYGKTLLLIVVFLSINFFPLGSSED